MAGATAVKDSTGKESPSHSCQHLTMLLRVAHNNTSLASSSHGLGLMKEQQSQARGCDGAAVAGQQSLAQGCDSVAAIESGFDWRAAVIDSRPV